MSTDTDPVESRATGAPRVSVVIPCQDEGVLLSEAVDSVLAQDLSVPFEIVIVDDGSQDEVTTELLSELDRHPSVSVVTHSRPEGPARARNAGVAAAVGDWIAFLDADDLLLPESLQRRWDVAVRERGRCFIAGDFVERRVDGTQASWIDRFETNPELAEQIGRIREARRTDSCVRIPDGSALLIWGVVRTPTVLVEKSAFDAVGGFDERLRVGEDFHLWIRLAPDGDLCVVPHPVAVYRRREGSLTVNEGHPAEQGRDATVLLLRDPSFERLRPALERRLLRMDRVLMWHYRSKGERAAALAAALRVLRAAPGDSSSWKALLGTILGR